MTRLKSTAKKTKKTKLSPRDISILDSLTKPKNSSTPTQPKKQRKTLQVTEKTDFPAERFPPNSQEPQAPQGKRLKTPLERNTKGTNLRNNQSAKGNPKTRGTKTKENKGSARGKDGGKDGGVCTAQQYKNLPLKKKMTTKQLLGTEVVTPNNLKDIVAKSMDLKLAKIRSKTKRAFLKAFQSEMARVAPAAKKAGISRTTFYRWLADDIAFATAIEDIREERLDWAEGSLLKLIKDGDVASTIFFMKTQGKHRGYIEGAEQNINLSAEHNLTMILERETDKIFREADVIDVVDIKPLEIPKLADPKKLG